MIRNCFLFTLLFCLFSHIVVCQKIEATPEPYLRPKHFNDKTSRTNFANDVLKKTKKHKREDWYIISDRNNNKVYESKDANSQVVATLNFQDVCYVVEDNVEWIKVASGEIGDLQTLGWMPKSSVLLWRRGLLDEMTGINLKGFILNKLKKFHVQKLESANLYPGPNTDSPMGKLALHDFYFVFKIEYDKGGNESRYLLGSNNILSKGRVEDLKGWVDVAKITNWNTRLCLEPNFSENGFNERKAQEKFAVKGFANSRAAQVKTEGNYNKDNPRVIYWDGDPAKTDNGVALNSDNPRRFLGDQIRFPILENQTDYFYSGLLATIKNQEESSGNNVSAASEIYIDPVVKESLSRKVSDLNMILLIEGSSPKMKEYVRVLKNFCRYLLKESSFSNTNISIGVYKDILETKEEDYLKLLNPTSDLTIINSFIDQVYWGRNGDFENLTCWQYGLHEALKNADLSKDATNVVVHIGNYADFSEDFIREEDAPANFRVAKEDLRNIFSEYEVNWVIANVDNDASIQSDLFNDNVREYINDFTKEIYYDYSTAIAQNLKDSFDIEQVSIPKPVTPKLSQGLMLSTKNFITKNNFLRSDKNTSIGPKDLFEFLQTSFEDIHAYNSDMLNVASNESSLKITDSNNIQFTDAVIGIVRSQINRGLGLRLPPEELKAKLKSIEQVKFFNEIYFAKKQPQQVHPPFSIVLFMPENDLKSYVEELNKLSLALDLPKDQAREQLQILLTEMARKFSASSFNDIRNLEINEIMDLIIGIDKEGYDIQQNLDYTEYQLKHVDNSKKFPDEAMLRLGSAIVSSTQRLESILKSKPPYDFKYSTDENNTYFWIPVEYMY